MIYIKCDVCKKNIEGNYLLLEAKSNIDDMGIVSYSHLWRYLDPKHICEECLDKVMDKGKWPEL
jgi:hypothetical protein